MSQQQQYSTPSHSQHTDLPPHRPLHPHLVLRPSLPPRLRPRPRLLLRARPLLALRAVSFGDDNVESSVDGSNAEGGGAGGVGSVLVLDVELEFPPTFTTLDTPLVEISLVNGAGAGDGDTDADPVDG